MQCSLMGFIASYYVSGYFQTDSLVQTHNLSCVFMIWLAYMERIYFVTASHFSRSLIIRYIKSSQDAGFELS